MHYLLQTARNTELLISYQLFLLCSSTQPFFFPEFNEFIWTMHPRGESMKSFQFMAGGKQCMPKGLKSRQSDYWGCILALWPGRFLGISVSPWAGWVLPCRGRWEPQGIQGRIPWKELSNPELIILPLTAAASLQNKAQKEPDSSFWLSQVNSFHGINEEQSQGTLQPHLCRAGWAGRGRMGILGSWWELCWEGPRSAPGPSQESRGCPGIRLLME